MEVAVVVEEEDGEEGGDGEAEGSIDGNSKTTSVGAAVLAGGGETALVSIFGGFVYVLPETVIEASMMKTSPGRISTA